MPKEYRPLLPAAPKGRDLDSTSSTSGTSEEPAKRRRVGVSVACNLCRAKKTRCDGGRPVCGICRKRGVKECTYTEKREPNDDAVEILELLRVLPESRAKEVLSLLRLHGDPAVVLSLTRNSPRDNQEPSPITPDQNEALLLKSPMESELMAKNPVVFPQLRSIPKGELEHSHLLHPIDTIPEEPPEQSYVPLPVLMFYLKKNIRIYNDGDSRPCADEMLKTGSDKNIDLDSAVRQFRSISSENGPSIKPRNLCDARLANLKISFWTNVPIPDDLAAKAISMYLETDHPLLGTFDPSRFVADLVDHRQVTCSIFLANALLYWGCQMYSAIDKRANDFIEKLCDETERLWSTEKENDSTLNMVSLQLLSLAYMGNGKDHKVLEYQLESVRMGVRLGLFGVDFETAKSKMGNIPKEFLASYSFAAWGVFNWAVLVSIFYRQPGTLYIKFPPLLAVPGSSELDSSVASRSILDGKLPDYMGNTFPAVCGLWKILRDVSLAYYAQEDDPADHVPLNFAETKYRELLAWAETLPTSVTRSTNCPHHVMILHMWIHAAVLDIWRPFIRQKQTVSSRLKTFSATGSSPKAAYKASVNQLKQLILDYRSNYESSAYTILWQTALLYLTTSVLQEVEDPSWRSWFLLCIYGYETLRRPFRVAETIGAGILTMTMRDTNITTEDARRILEDLKLRGLPEPVESEIRATFMGDLDMATNSPERARVENLAKDFEDVAIFRDYTNPPDNYQDADLD